jgi:hypothetical protein
METILIHMHIIILFFLKGDSFTPRNQFVTLDISLEMNLIFIKKKQKNNSNVIYV